MGRPPLPATEGHRAHIHVRASEQTIAQLVALAEALGTDKSEALRHAIQFALAARGEAPPAPLARPPEPPPGPTAADVQAIALRVLAEASAAIRAAAPSTRRAKRAPAPPAAPADIKPAVLATVRALNVKGRYGDVVPLPPLRAALARQGLTDRAAIDAALLALERDYAVDLSIAQSPASLKRGSASRASSGRGAGS